MSHSVNYVDRTTTFACNDCGEMFEADGTDFHDALDEYKRHGGRAVLDEKGRWRHLCEDCA